MSRQTVPKQIRDILPKQCCNCGSTTDLIYHHIVPHELGGKTIPSNIAVVCSECHGKIHFGNKGVIIHGELIKEGMAKARESGIKLGRRPRNSEEHVLRTIASKSTQFNADSLITEQEIMDELGIGMTCYSKYKRKLFAAMNESVWPYDWPKPKQVRHYPMYDRLIKKMRAESC